MQTLYTPAKSLGSHFTAVSWASTLILTAIPVLLVAGGAPAEAPSVDRMLDRLSQAGLAEAIVVSVFAIGIGLLLNPLQFPATQILEGYWGPSKAARRAMSRSTRSTRQRWETVASMHPDAANVDQARTVDPVIDKQEADRFLTRYPDELVDLMPTRLGNVLRRHERLAGAPYGLDAIASAPFLAQVAPESVRAYYDDQRTALDIAVRMVVVWSLATVIEVVLLWPFGLWMLLPFVTSIMAVMAYRGAVHAASSYGVALGVLVGLGRLQLYEAMGLSAPRDSVEESERNEAFSLMLAGTYKHLPYR